MILHATNIESFGRDDARALCFVLSQTPGMTHPFYYKPQVIESSFLLL